jgi:hypothetical protein
MNESFEIKARARVLVFRLTFESGRIPLNFETLPN